MCGAVVLFACNDAAAKYLNGHMHTVQVVWARYMSAFALADRPAQSRSETRR